MDIRTALDELVKIEESLSITQPIPASVKKAWKYMAPQEQTLTDTPCWMNSWTLTSDVPHEHGATSWLQEYDIQMQLFIEDASQRAADIATAFHVALIAALKTNPTLSGTVVRANLRGATPTLSRLERAGRAYMGLDLFMETRLLL